MTASPINTQFELIFKAVFRSAVAQYDTTVGILFSYSDRLFAPEGGSYLTSIVLYHDVSNLSCTAIVSSEFAERTDILNNSFNRARGARFDLTNRYDLLNKFNAFVPFRSDPRLPTCNSSRS